MLTRDHSIFLSSADAHVYPQVEYAIPAFTVQRQSITALWLVRNLRAVFGGLPEPNRACLVGVWYSRDLVYRNLAPFFNTYQTLYQTRPIRFW